MKRQADIDWQAARASIERTRRRLEGAEVTAEERGRILRQRMEALAQAHAGQEDEGGKREMIVFRLDEERFALPLASVTEVLTSAAIAPVPGAPPIIAGVMPVRGEIRPVFDLQQLLGAASTGPRDFVVLAMHQNHEVGFLVAGVEDISLVGLTDLQPGPEGNPRIRGITVDLIQVLDLEVLLNESADMANSEESLKLRDRQS